MRNVPMLFCLLPVLASCLGADWTATQKRVMSSAVPSRDQEHLESAPPATSAGDTLLYFSGVWFPEEYDWIKDTALGNGEAEVYLLENWYKKVSFPSGYAHRVSPDPDTHHLIGGDLYTEFSTTSETIVKKNGDLLFSYPGREKIDWMIVDGEHIYTLGRNRSGDGFSFRKDGEVILERSSGTIIRGLHKDSGHLYFFYSKSSAGVVSHYMVEDGLENQLFLPDFSGTLKDLIVWNGEVHILSAADYGFQVTSSVWQEGIMLPSYYFEDPHFLTTDNGLYVYGLAERSNTYTKSMVAVSPDNSEYFFTTIGELVFYDSGNWASAYDDCCGTVSLEYGDNQVFCETGVRLLGGSCVSFGNGILAAGLSPTDFHLYPRTWVNGVVKTIDYHGYLTGVEIIPPNSESLTRQN